MPLHGQIQPEAHGPPAVLLDAEGVTVWLAGAAYSRILWSQVTSVEVGIVTAPNLGYAEAFWRLVGEGVELSAPVELIVNADHLNEKLFTLPGFDMEAYRRALEAEARGESGQFICWRKGVSR